MANSLNALAADVARLKVASPMVTPAQFGAVGDGASHPASAVYAALADLQAVYPFATDLSQELDWLGWQAALNHGGLVNCSGRERYKPCNTTDASRQPLTVIAGQSWVEGAGAIMDWTSFGPQPDAVNLLSDPTFQLYGDASPWKNSTLYSPDQITSAVFGGGHAVFTDPPGFPTSPTGHFYSFGQTLTLEPGRYRVTATYSATLGASYANGNFNPPFGSLAFATAVGDGQNPFGAAAAMPTNALGGEVSQTVQFDFSVAEVTTADLTVQGGGYANLELTEIKVSAYNPDCGFFLTRDGSGEHYPIRQPVAGLNILGPGSSVPVAAVRWKSFVNLDGNISEPERCVLDGWGVGMSPEDGAYLTNVFGVEVNNCGTACSHPPGQNSGENFRFYGGGFYNCGVAIENASGAEITLYGTALDYCGQILKGNTGRVALVGVHVEHNLPQEVGVPAWECVGYGSVDMYNGKLLGAGSSSFTCPEPPIRLTDATSKFRLHGTEVYGYSSTQGVMCSGEGMLSAPGGWINTGNPNVANLLSRAACMDVLAGAGSFEPPAGYPLIGLDASGIGLDGGVYSRGSTTTDQWNSSTLSVSVSTAHPQTGERSLKITKLAAVDASVAGDQLIILIPQGQGQDVFFSGSYLSPDNVGPGQSPVYYRAFDVQVIGRDVHGRPIFGPGFVFRGEADIYLDLTGATGWKGFNINTVYGSPQGSAWATHLALVFDLQIIPPLSLYFDGLIANVL